MTTHRTYPDGGWIGIDTGSGFAEYDYCPVAEYDYGPVANPTTDESLLPALARLAAELATLKACIIVLGQQIADLKAKIDEHS